MLNEQHTKACRDAFAAADATDHNCAQGKFTLKQLETIAACPDESHGVVRITLAGHRCLRTEASA